MPIVLFVDVYGTDDDQQIQVQNNDNCKPIAPLAAAYAPKRRSCSQIQKRPVNGDVVSDGDLNREKMKIDISRYSAGMCTRCFATAASAHAAVSPKNAIRTRPSANALSASPNLLQRLMSISLSRSCKASYADEIAKSGSRKSQGQSRFG